MEHIADLVMSGGLVGSCGFPKSAIRISIWVAHESDKHLSLQILVSRRHVGFGIV